MSPDSIQAIPFPQQPHPEAIERAAAILRAGGLVAFPTETVYGLGADASNLAALQRLYAVKGRPERHPVIVHLPDADALSGWAREIPDAARRLVDAFWPGPLTLILPRTEQVPDAVTGGQDTVGLRVPGHPVALELLRLFGGGLAAPSANRFGRISPTQAAHVQADLGADVDLILDGGECDVGVESTIVAFRDGQPVILRPGMITAARIAETLGLPELIEPPVPSNPVRAPGTLASHYAPRAPLQLVATAELEFTCRQALHAGGPVGLLARQCPPELVHALYWVEAETEPEAYARELYARLRWMDGQGMARILVEEVPEGDAWAAVRDRLQRASIKN